MNISNMTNFKNIEYAQKAHSKNSEGVKSVSLAFGGGLDKMSKIMGQKDCWKLYEEDALDAFIRSDKDLEDALGNILDLARKSGVKLNIPTLYKLKSIDEVNNFFDVVKSKYDIDLNTPPTVYRYVGKSEADALRRGELILPQRSNGMFEVSINPDINWNKYVVTFNQSEKFSVLNPKGLMRKKEGTYSYLYRSPSYAMDDVELVESKFK